MSKSGNYNLSEIEKRDALIQEMSAALRNLLPWFEKGKMRGIAWLSANDDIKAAETVLNKLE